MQIVSQWSPIRNPNFYILTLTHGAVNPSDSSVYYGGCVYGAVPTTAGSTYYRLYVPKSGVITKMTLTVAVGGTFGTTETSTMAIRVNDTTDYTISSSVLYNGIGSSYTAANQNITVNAGDYIVLKWTTPAWATNPTAVTNHISLEIQTTL